jgi:hypothetical protein
MRVSPSTNLVLTINGRQEEEVKSFTYLGSIVTIDVGALEDVHSHIKKANGDFVELYPVWRIKIELTYSCLIQILSHSQCL